MSEESKGTAETASFSEKIDVTLIRGGKTIYPTKMDVKDIIKAYKLDYCPSCGEKPTFVPIYFCEKCGQRFLVRLDLATGKTIIVPMGKEQLPKELR